MSSRILHSRLLLPVLSRITTTTTTPQRLKALSYSTTSAAVADHPSAAGDAVPSDGAAGMHPPDATRVEQPGKPRGFLKFTAIAAVAAAFGATGYVTYAYTLDEVNQKTRDFRKNTSYLAGDDASSFEKFWAMAYSTARKVPVSAIELYLDLRSKIEEQLRGFTEPLSDKLLPDLHPLDQNVFTLVLDLNETLVYFDWQRDRGWRTYKRPGVDAFLQHLANFYEIVVFSDQQSLYMDPVIDRLDQRGCIRYRLARDATKYQDGKHYRDLSKLNRNPGQVLYISGHALDSSLQPENCVQIKPWKLEDSDTQLLDLIPFLEYVALHKPADVRAVLASYQGHDIAKEFIERSRHIQQKKQPGHFWRR